MKSTVSAPNQNPENGLVYHRLLYRFWQSPGDLVLDAGMDIRHIRS